MSSFLQLVLTLVIIITGAKAGGWLANRLRQSAVLGELLGMRPYWKRAHPSKRRTDRG